MRFHPVLFSENKTHPEGLGTLQSLKVSLRDFRPSRELKSYFAAPCTSCMRRLGMFTLLFKHLSLLPLNVFETIELTRQNPGGHQFYLTHSVQTWARRINS